MSDQALTVGTVLFPKGGTAASTKDHPTLRKVEDTIRKELKSVDMEAVNEALLNKLVETLDDPFVRALAGAWSKYSEILKYRDREKYPPGNTYLVSLAEHTVSSKHRPSIEIFINKVRCGTLEFLVTLAIETKAFQLEIEDAKIRRVRTGTWHGSGEVALEGKRIYRKKLEPVRLPGVVDLGEGVAIGQ